MARDLLFGGPGSDYFNGDRGDGSVDTLDGGTGDTDSAYNDGTDSLVSIEAFI